MIMIGELGRGIKNIDGRGGVYRFGRRGQEVPGFEKREGEKCRIRISSELQIELMYQKNESFGLN